MGNFETRDEHGAPGEPARALMEGRAHYQRGQWAKAYEALALADGTSSLDVDDLSLLAWSAGLTGRDSEFLVLLERVHNENHDRGDGPAAARAAFWLGFRLFSMGEVARGGGWFGRAQRLVEREAQPCVEAGYLLIPVAHRHLVAGEHEAAHEVAARVVEMGERFGDADLVTFARNVQGRALIRQGRVEVGLALLDEAMVATTTGELSPLMTGLIYCSVIATCQQVYALDRAREWTSALASWCEAQPELVTFTGSCLVHRSEILQLGGAWPEAIEEARRASSRLSGTTDPGSTADAFYQQAEIHRLRGEFTRAEEAYRSASQIGREPQPGLALLRLAQGRDDAAATAIRRVLEATKSPLQRARLLPAYVEIMTSVGDLDAARAGCSELEEIAARFATDVLRAMAAHARGALSLASGDARAALEPLRDAFEVWRAVGAPYLAARLRVLVGRACRLLGDDEGAELELSAASDVFERLGALPDLACVELLRKRASPNGASSTVETRSARCHGLTPRELEVLRLVAAGKTNKAIAKELTLSEKTIDRHVSNIFGKLGVSSRSAATAFAYENHLV